MTDSTPQVPPIPRPTPRGPRGLGATFSTLGSKALGTALVCAALWWTVPVPWINAQPADDATASDTTASDTAETEEGSGTSPDASDETVGDDEAAVDEGPTSVVVIEVDSAIHPVAAEFIADSLAEADRRRSEVLVLKLSTPGGLLTSTRDITKAMLQARTPVVVYVSPGGSQAASAGFFILMASDIAAMAPGTNTGSAHPVGGQGEDIEGDMGKKVEEDAMALIRSLANQHGRDVDLAQSAVLESRSFTAEEALESGLIEVVAPSLTSLLVDLDGRVVEKAGEAPRTLRTAEAEVVELEMSPLREFLAALTDPQVAGILMFLGMLGLYMELSNPGAIFPGVIGAICLLLGLYALSVLPVNYAGVGLVILGLLLFIIELQVPTYGLLTLGGSISLILGAVLLFKDVDPAMRVGLETLVGVAVAVSVSMGLLSFKALAVRRQKVTTGQEGLVGKRGVVRQALAPKGKIFVHGEIWAAVAEQTIPPETDVEVMAVEGLTLRVRPWGDGSQSNEG